MDLEEWARSLQQRYSEQIENDRLDGIECNGTKTALDEVTEWLANFEKQVLSHPGFLRRQSIDPRVVNSSNWGDYIERLLLVSFTVSEISGEADIMMSDYQFLLVADGIEKRMYGTRVLRVPLRHTGNVADGILVEPDQMITHASNAYHRYVTGAGHGQARFLRTCVNPARLATS